MNTLISLVKRMLRMYYIRLPLAQCMLRMYYIRPSLAQRKYYIRLPLVQRKYYIRLSEYRWLFYLRKYRKASELYMQNSLYLIAFNGVDICTDTLYIYIYIYILIHMFRLRRNNWTIVQCWNEFLLGCNPSVNIGDRYV